MKISLKRAPTIRKIVVSILIMGLFISQMNTAVAFIANCDSVDPNNLTDDQKTLYDGGTFDPVSKYATQIESRFKEVQTMEVEFTEEAFTDFRSKNECPEIDGYIDATGAKVADSFYSIYRNAFATKIEDTFQSKNSNNSLTSIAIMLFDEYSKKQDMLCGIYHHYLFEPPLAEEDDTENPSITQSDANTRFTECKNILVQAVDESQQLMLSHIKSTAAEKKATLLVEKYKAINGQLRELNNSMARMYAFFQTFANKLLFKANKQMIGM